MRGREDNAIVDSCRQSHRNSLVGSRWIVVELESGIKSNSGNVRSRSSVHVNRCVINRPTKILQQRNTPVCHLRHVDHSDISFTAAPPCFSRASLSTSGSINEPSLSPRSGGGLLRAICASRPAVIIVEQTEPAFGCGWPLTCSARA